MMDEYMRLPFYSTDERGQMTTMPYDPQNRGEYMQLSSGGSQMPAGTYTDPLEILRMQAQEQAAPTGIMGFLRNPAIRAALQGASQGFAQAAQSGVGGRGYALSQGLAGAAQGVGSWEEQQAKAAAERLKMMLDERRRVQDEQKASMWNTDTGRRYSLKAEQLKRDAAAQGKTLDDDVAMQMAMDYVDVFPYDQRRATETLAQQFRRELLGIKESQDIAKEERSPEVAAEVTKAQKTAEAEVGREQDIQGQAQTAERMIGLLDQAENIIPRASGGVPQAVGATVAGKLGIATDTQSADDQMDMIHGELMGQAAQSRILGINPTNVDLQMYEKMVGNLNDRNKPSEVKLSSLRWLRDKQRATAARAKKPAGGAPAAAPKPSGTSIEDRLKKYR